MRFTIEIDLEVSDQDTVLDILRALDATLPYMSDNVAVKSTQTDVPALDPNGPLTAEQRRALFAAFDDVFADTTDQARYAFTGMVLGRNAPVSWSSAAFPHCITRAEANTVHVALRALNV